MSFIARTRSFINPFFSRMRLQLQGCKCPYCFTSILPPRAVSRAFGAPIVARPNLTCPSCSATLPVDFFEASSKVIALIGSTESGKTTYMTVLAKKLTETNMLNIISTSCGADIPNTTERQEQRNRVESLYDRKEILDGTIANSNTVVRIKRGRDKSMFLSLQDAPGGNLTSLTAVMTQNQIANAEGIICLLDPFNIDILYEMLRELPEYRLLPAPTSDIYTEIIAIYDFLKLAGRIGRNNKVDIPIAFCISKADLLKQIASLYIAGDADRSYSSLNELLAETKLSVDDMRLYLEDLGKDQRDERLLTTIQNRFNNFAIFPVSSLGDVNKDAMDNGQLLEKPDPEGVEHPLFWLFKQLKFI